MSHDTSGSKRTGNRTCSQACLLLAVILAGVSGCSRDQRFDAPGLLEQSLSFAGSLSELQPGDSRYIDTRASDGRIEYSVVTWASWQPVQTDLAAPFPAETRT